jgi:hypothetical protein
MSVLESIEALKDEKKSIERKLKGGSFASEEDTLISENQILKEKLKVYETEYRKLIL